MDEVWINGKKIDMREIVPVYIDGELVGFYHIQFNTTQTS